MKNFINFLRCRLCMISKSQLLIVVLAFIVTNSFSQTIGQAQNKIETDLPTIIPPSPTVATLMRFEEVPVDHYTGIPDISIPLYSTKISNNLNLNIGLSYNPMGIRIDERSGWTGTGWTLNAESVISRTVMDVPDEIFKVTSTSDYADGDIGTFSNNFYDLCNLDFATATNAEYAEYSEFLWETANGNQHADYQPDLFQFSFFGNSGRFIILNINGILTPKIISSDQKIKINLNYSIPQSIYAIQNDAFDLDSFEIVDTNGNKFLFEEKEITTSTSTMFAVNQIGTQVLNTVLNPPKELIYTSAWKLTEIRKPNDELLVTYHYQDVNEIFSTPKNEEKNRLLYTNNNVPSSLLGSLKAENAGLMPLKSIITGNDLDIDSKKLHKIILRNNTEVWFTKANNHPEYTSCTLSGIDVKDTNGISYKNFDFSYYTNPNGRLFLNKVNDVSGQSLTLPYNLTYDKPEDLPAFGDENKDIWGYYKGPQLSYYNAVDYSKKVKTGVLKSITYPTSGKKEFDFEINQIGYIGQSLVNVNDLPENQQIFSPLPFKSFSGNLNGSGMDNPLPQRLFFQVNSDTTGEITYQTIGAISSEIIYTNHSVSINKVTLKNGVSTPQSENDIDSAIRLRNFDIQDNNTQEKVNVSLSPGWYMVTVYTPSPYFFPNPGLPNEPNHTILNVDVTARYGDFIYNNRNLRGGGLRIKSIRFTDNNQDETKTDFNYNVPYTVNTTENPNPNDNNKPLSSGAFEGSILMTRSYLKEMDLITPVECPPRSINGVAPTNYKFEVTRYLNAVSGQLTKGNYVGYKNVSVTKSGNGRTDYKFTNSLDYPTYNQAWYMLPPAYFDVPVPDLEHKKGLLIEKSVFNENGNKLTKTTNEYNFVEIAEHKYKYSYYQGNCPNDRFYSYYQNYINKTPDIDSSCGNNSNPIFNSNCGSFPGYLGFREAKHIWGKTFLSETETIEYFYEDNTLLQKLARQEFSYNLENFQISQQDAYFDESGNEEHLQTKYFYSVGPSLNSNSISIRNRLAIDLNKVNEILETQSFKNGTKISETHKIFYEFSTDQVLVQSIKVGKGNNTLTEQLEFLRYDNFDNPLEVSKTNGTPISYIYGFNKTLPVAQLINTPYVSIENILGTNFSFAENLSSANEVSLKNGLPNALMSFYRYHPILGVISTSDERGYEMTYQYDEFNRLKSVKDSDGKILSENIYYYENQY